MSYPPYGQNPYGQNPYGQQPHQQPGSQQSGPPGAWGQPPQQQGWGQGGPGQGQGGPGQGWGQQQAPSWGQQPGQPQHQPSAWAQPSATPGPEQHQGGHGPAGQNGPAQPVPPTPVPEPQQRKASLARHEIPVVTIENLPGREVVEVVGEVIGVVTRPSDLRGAPEASVTLTEIRQDAVAAMVQMALDAQADAVVGLRFDGGAISDGATEVAAYGTALRLAGSAPKRAGADDSETDEGTPGADGADEGLSAPTSPEPSSEAGQPGDLGQGDQPNERNPFVTA